MSEREDTRGGVAAAARLVSLLGLVVVAALSGRFAVSLSARAAAMLLIGEAGLLLAGFTVRDIAGAFRTIGFGPRSGRSARFWEAAARNAWNLGVLGTLAGFVTQICSGNAGPTGFLAALGDATLSTVYGLILAAIALAVGFGRKNGAAADVAPRVADGPTARSNLGRWEHWLGYAIFAAVILWLLMSPAGQFRPVDWFVHWPAWLVVGGGGLALALAIRYPLDGRSLTLGLAAGGLIAAFLGLSRALQGFGRVSIAAVAEGITFTVSACFAALVGMLFFGMPIWDRSRHAEEPGMLRVCWYCFPLAVLAFLVLTIVMVLVPMEAPKPAP